MSVKGVYVSITHCTFTRKKGSYFVLKGSSFIAAHSNKEIALT